MKKQFYFIIALLFVTLSSWAQTTTFETFTLGTVNYQGTGSTTVTGLGYIIPSPYGSLWTTVDEWGTTPGAYDQAVKDDGTGNKVLRLSNAVATSSTSNQVNSPSSTQPAGETTAALWNDRGPSHSGPFTGYPVARANAATKYFHGGFRFKSATGAAQPGLFISVNSAPRQSAVRMSYIAVNDAGTGFNLEFSETGVGGSFAPSNTVIATGLSYTAWHQVDFYVEFVDGLNGDGTGNDIVTVMLDGAVIHTGTTWETLYATAGWTATPDPVAVDAVTFFARNTAAPGTLGNGLYFDDVTVDNAQAPGPVNVYTDNTLTTLVSNHNTIQAAINASTTLNGYVVTIANGTYNLTSTLTLNKELTILGESETGVIINTTGTPSGAWGINPNKSNTTLSNFTVVPNATDGGYPIHVASGIALTPISNISLSHITIDGAYRTPFDFNGVDNLTISNLTAKNATRGNGIQVSGCVHVNASDITTSGNAWGGMAVYVGKDVGRGSDDVTIDGTTSSFGENNDIYVQNEFGFVNTNVTVTGFEYSVQNVGSVGYTFLKKDKSAAYTFAATLTNPQNSTVKKISTGEFWVGSTLKIQAAIDAAVNGNVVNVDAGTYTEATMTLTKSLTLKGANAGLPAAIGTGVTPSGRGAETILTVTAGILPNASNITIDGFHLKRGERIITSNQSANNFKILNNIIENTATGANEMLHFYGAGLTRDDWEIKNNLFTGPYGGTGTILFSDNGFARLEIEANDFKGVGETALWGKGDNIVIKGNYFGPTNGLGMNCNGLNNPTIVNNYIEVQGWGFELTTSNGGLIKSNVFNGTHASVDGGVAYSRGIDLFGTRWDGPSSNGLIIQGNTFQNFTSATINPGDQYRGIHMRQGNENITIKENIFQNCHTGIATVSATPLVKGIQAYDNDFSGTIIAVNNGSTEVFVASCNWWGTTDYTAIVPKVTGNVNFLNFLTSNDLSGSGSCTGVGPVVNLTTGQSYMAIQPAINAALAGQVIKVPAGTYTEDVNTTLKPGVIISIGASPGCVTINGNVTLTSADTWVVDIEGTTACTGFDKATINGNFTTGGAKLEVKVDPAYVPALASEYEIFNVSGTITGVFSATTYMSGRNRFNVAIAAPSIKLVTTDPLAIDIALYEVGCAAFKVVLKPSVTLDDNPSNVQFTLKYPASVVLTNVVSTLGLVTGTPLTEAGGFKYETFVVAPLTSAAWVAGTEYTVLTFNHNQLGTGTGDFVILPPADATITTSFYAEFKGSDVTGTIYAGVLASWLNGCPVHNETKDLWYYKIQPAIDEAASADVVRAFNVPQNSGVFAENLVINKALTLVGPNDAVNPNTGARVAEAIIVPYTIAPSTGEIIHVAASNVTIKGFTIDGDNPLKPANGYGFGGADMHAAEGVTVYETGVNNLIVQNNILKNLTYFGVTLYDYPAGVTSSGHVISDNKFQDLGTYDASSGLDLYGGGVLIYNNQYTRITNNVMTNVRTGIQTGNFWRANSGSADFQVIENNTIQARRNAIFHNLHYSSASPYTIKNNTITALANANETTWMGIRYASLSVNSFALNNMIDAAGVTIPSWGHVIWNVKSTTPADIKGGEVKNVDYGVFANNFEGYASPGTDGAYAVVTGMTIMPKTTGYGIYGLDSPGYFGDIATGLVDVKAYFNKIIGGAEAIKLAETRANKVSATIESNSITGYTHAVSSNLAEKVQATCNWWGTANLSAIASKITNANVIYTPYRSNNTEIAPKVYPYGFEPAGLCETVLPLKVWLQGPYNATTNEMATGINAKLPTNQPFSVAPWGYTTGTETLPNPLSADVVDWVLVEARTNTTDAWERCAGLLYKDGSVNAAFDKLAQDVTYHFVVYQRNHLPVMSATPVSVANYPNPLDLTVEANLFGNANLIPNKPAINLEGSVWGMIAGDVTHNGTLQYSGPGNDRGPIIARINAGVVGATMNSVLSNGYWFEDVLMNNDVRYTGTSNDRAPILSNLGTLTGTNYLNAIYRSPVPMVNTSGIQAAPAMLSRPVNINLEDKGIALSTSELIKDGVIDNIQFTLAWKNGNTNVEQAINNYTSNFMVMPQGKPVTIGGVNYQMFVSASVTNLPKTWNTNEMVTLMSFTDKVVPGSVWIAENEFTDENNAMYYVSIWGENYTGDIIQKVPTSVDEMSLYEGVKLYPNPTSIGKVNVELSEVIGNNVQVSIYDVNGRVLRNTKMGTAGNVITLDVSTMNNGVYFVKVVDTNRTYNCRFIVNN